MYNIKYIELKTGWADDGPATEKSASTADWCRNAAPSRGRRNWIRKDMPSSKSRIASLWSV